METMDVQRDGVQIPKSEHGIDGGDAALKTKRKRNTTSPPGEQVPKRSKIQPRIIHSVCPPLIHAEPTNFMRIVQSLTGCALTRLRCEELERGSRSSPTSTICQAASSPSSSTSTDEQHEASLSSRLALLHQASSCSPAAGNTPCRLTQTEPYCDEVVHGLSCNFLMGESKEGGYEASSSSVIMSSYEGDHEASSAPLFIARHGELEASCPLMCNYGGEQEMSYSARKSCEYAGDSNLQLEENLGIFGFEASGDDDPLFWLGSNASVDPYLEHLLLSYDHNVVCKNTSTSSMLADVCDPSLLKDLL